jgi:hypothetical protein
MIQPYLRKYDVPSQEANVDLPFMIFSLIFSTMGV